MIENLVDKRFVQNHQTSTKLVDKCDGGSSNKVKFDLTEVNTNVVNDLVLVPIVPEHQWKSVKDPVAFTNDKPVGTGPFTEVDNFSAQLYTQCRNPHYWDNANLAIDCIRMPQMATNDQVLAAALSVSLAAWKAVLISFVHTTGVLGRGLPRSASVSGL